MEHRHRNPPGGDCFARRSYGNVEAGGVNHRIGPRSTVTPANSARTVQRIVAKSEYPPWEGPAGVVATGGRPMDDVAIELDDRPGALAQMGEALGRAGVSVEEIGRASCRERVWGWGGCG